jgi:DNA-binding transcriptional MerR regulator
MTTTAAPGLKIGEVAHRTGLPVKTIRYYEDIGLLTPTVERSLAGYRLFSNRVLNRLAFIKRAQSLGLSLTEIKVILDIHDRGEVPCGEIKHHIEERLNTIDAQIRSLETLRSELQGLLSHWQESPSPDRIAHTICPNIQ